MMAVASLFLVAFTMAGTMAGPTPAEEKIIAAKHAIDKTPEHYQAYNQLALAQTRRARETGDPTHYVRALEALETSFRLAPDNYSGLRIRTWALLGRHEFSEALQLAEDLNRQAPDDILIYAFLTDAHVELGNYEKAEQAAQWMLDLRPGNVAGMTRGAYLREIFGDVVGAIEWMWAAYEQTPFHEVEDRAWVLTELAHLELSRGKLEGAEEAASEALALFPDYHYALAELAKVRLAQDRAEDAAALLRKRYDVAPHPENLFELAVALSRAGREDEARELFASFEEQARVEVGSWDNANRELVFYYTDVSGEPEKALAVARRDIERRRDVFTLDAYAWALYASGKHDAAWEQIQWALEPGIRDARLLYHAGRIATARGDETEAERLLRLSLASNPHADVANDARKALNGLAERYSYLSAVTGSTRVRR